MANLNLYLVIALVIAITLIISLFIMIKSIINAPVIDEDYNSDYIPPKEEKQDNTIIEEGHCDNSNENDDYSPEGSGDLIKEILNILNDPENEFIEFETPEEIELAKKLKQKFTKAITINLEESINSCLDVIQPRLDEIWKIEDSVEREKVLKIIKQNISLNYKISVNFQCLAFLKKMNVPHKIAASQFVSNNIKKAHNTLINTIFAIIDKQNPYSS